MNDFIYIFGLVVVLLYLVLDLDSLVLDVLFLFTRKRYKDNKLSFEMLEEKPPRLLGIIIASWKEEDVIEQVISNIIESQLYPQSMYHIFLGVYPNDEETKKKATFLSKKFPNVHMIVNIHSGPTNKADNLNNVMNYIKLFEKRIGWKFASLTVHDSEDIIHPYELKLTNYLIDLYPALQLPVFPLQDEPTIKNFFHDMTRSTYTDEFAENHYRTMVMRDVINAVVPSAGTGFVLTRKVLDHFADQDLFPSGSLTEDYKLSLILAEHGFKVHYALGRVKRIQENGKTRWDYVATRSIFPGTFKTAVRQKTRWVYGITMQSVGLYDIFIRRHEAGIMQRFSVFRDIKAKVSNLLVLPGYMIFIYFVFSLFFNLPEMYPYGSLSFWLCMALSIIMIERQILRGIALKNVYNWRYVVASCLVPPLLPLRLIWGNVINFCATFNAWRQHFFGIKQKQSKKKAKWDKTDHEFPETDTLKSFHRNLTDSLIRRNFASPKTLAYAIEKEKSTGVNFAEILLAERKLTERELGMALSGLQNTIFFPDVDKFRYPEFLPYFDKDKLTELVAFPILKTKNGFVMSISVTTPHDALQALGKEIGQEMEFVYSNSLSILKAISDFWQGRYLPHTDLYPLFKTGHITWQQALIALSYEHLDEHLSIIQYMGLENLDDWEAPLGLKVEDIQEAAM